MKKYMVASLLAFMMIGCGGGSSPIIDGSIVKLSGVAVDDLIVGGVVNVYSADDESKPLVTGRTSRDDGSYNLDLSQLGLVILKVTCDSESLMMNPTTKVTTDCLPGLELSSAATLTKETRSLTANISPLSELVVRQMRVNGLSSASLASSQKNIGLMFGLDPLGDSPVANDQYKRVINAIHIMADAQPGKSILNVIDEISYDLEDGKADSSISVSLAGAMKKAGANNNLTKYNGLFSPDTKDTVKKDDKPVVKKDDDKKKDDEKAEDDETEASPLTDIEVSKAFFKELRTQAMSVVDYDNSGTAGFLDNESEKLSKELEEVSLNLDLTSKYIMSLFNGILVSMYSNYSEYEHLIESEMVVELLQDLDDNRIWTYIIKDNGEAKYEGTITIPSNLSSSTSPSDFEPLIAKFDGTLPTNSVNNGNSGVQTFKSDITLTKESYGAALVLDNASLSNDSGSIAIADAHVRAGYTFDDEQSGDERLDMQFVALDSVTIKGSTVSYDLQGVLKLTDYVTNDSIKDKGFGSDFDTIYNGGVLPQKLNFVGSVLNRTTEAKIEATIDVNWLNVKSMNLLDDSDDTPTIEASIIGTLKMPQRPLMLLSLGYKNLDQAHNLTFSYSYDKTVINGIGSLDEAGENGKVVLSSPNGIKATIFYTDGEVVYGAESSVKRNGVVIGYLEERENIPVIKYTDGSFESLP